MDPREIAKAYDQLADRWHSGAAGSYGIEQHKRAIAFVKERHRALDVGCGSSGRIIDLLASHGFEVEGLDISPRMIALAAQRHPNLTFHEAYRADVNVVVSGGDGGGAIADDDRGHRRGGAG